MKTVYGKHNLQGTNVTKPLHTIQSFSFAPTGDFVFEKNYVLPTLREVDKYINTNGHLQGIPSSAEVKQNGIDAGDMIARLLQKIEELTLYSIDLQKQIDEIKKEK